MCQLYRKLRCHDISVQIMVNGVLEITNPIMFTGCIKSIISSMMKIVELLTPHTGLSIFNYVCIVIYMYLFSSLKCKLKTGNDDA